MFAMSSLQTKENADEECRQMIENIVADILIIYMLLSYATKHPRIASNNKLIK